MDYLGDKLNSLTGEALSGINNMRKTAKDKDGHQAQQRTAKDVELSARRNQLYAPVDSTSSQPAAGRAPPSVPFGGDSFLGLGVASQPAAAPIGFRPEYLCAPPPAGAQQLAGPAKGADSAASDASLYRGDTWTRLWFQRVMLLSLVRLLLFIRKVYEDFHATKSYSGAGHTGHFLISAATLFLPTIVFTLYRVSRYLQLSLPALRPSSQAHPYPSAISAGAHALPAPTEGAATEGAASGRQAKLSQQQDDDGLVTARQTPTNLDEFHDSQSHQEQTLDRSSSSPASSSAPKGPPVAPLESFDVEQLGDIPDKHTTRLALGASEQLLHGVLFVFWQLKRQVDVLGYLVERSCVWRRPRDDEQAELTRLRTGSDGLEWFQDFYAAFLAILAQVYTLGLVWSSAGARPTTGTLQSALSGLEGAISADTGEHSFSSAAKSISDALRQQALAGNALNSKDLLIMSELLVSSAVVFSLLLAVRRRDDGPLTLGLSILGWGSIFASRIIIVALAFVHIGWRIMLPLVGAHVLGITGWIYRIAIDSHNGKPGESDEAKWNSDADVEAEVDADTATELGAAQQAPAGATPATGATGEWSVVEHVILVTQIVTLFAIPSLFYWPIMFNLKLHYRPFKYLVLILSENFILIPIIWLQISANATAGQWYLLGAVGGFSTVGFVFVSLYIACKPSLTEYFARADELFNEAQQSGVYYEFCSRVFKMPDLSRRAFRRLMDQSEIVEEIEIQPND